MRSLQILGIVLFRFRMLPRLWAILLIAANAGCLLFIDTVYGQCTRVAAGAAVAVMAVIYARLGIGHVFWVPMLIFFAFNLPDAVAQPWLFNWVTSVTVFISVSLAIDSVDVMRFLRGEREPYYAWRPASVQE